MAAEDQNADLPKGWTEDLLEPLVRTHYEAAPWGGKLRPMSDDAWRFAKKQQPSLVALVRAEILDQIAEGKIMLPGSTQVDESIERRAQRDSDLAILTQLRSDLPTGHHELPGVIRVIELLHVIPLGEGA